MTRSATAPQSGWVRAELDGPGAGDWDLAIFDRASGRLVAGSSSFGADEVAEGLAVEGTRLIVQACRMSGGGERAQPERELDRPAGRAGRRRSRSCDVATPTRDRKELLTEPRPRPDRARRQGLRGRAAPRRGRRPHPAREQVLLHGRDAGPGAPGHPRPRRGRPLREPGARLRAPERPRRLPAPARLLRGPEEARRREPRPRAADHACRTRRGRDARSRASRSRRTSTTCATASPCSCRWACTTRASGPRASTRSSGRSSS